MIEMSDGISSIAGIVIFLSGFGFIVFSLLLWNKEENAGDIEKTS